MSNYYNPTPEENDAYKQLFIAASKGQSSTIGGADAVKFFVASGVPIATLKQVWAIASNGQREMGPREFSTAMRLIALAQAGHAISEDTLKNTESAFCNPPSFQGITIETKAAAPPAPTPQAPGAAPSGPVNWAIPAEQRAGYEKLWAGLAKNASGKLEGKDAAAFFAKSGQQREVLRNVWQLADVGGDGMMDQSEFVIGMHLTMMAKKGITLPSTLPQELLQSAGGSASGMATPSSGMAAPSTLGMSSTSLLESDRDLGSSRNLPRHSSSAPPMAISATNTSMVGGMGGGVGMMPTGLQDSVEYDRLRQDATALNSSTAFATSRIEESRTAIKGQSDRASSELNSLKAERERLMQALNDATSAFNSDMEKLRRIEEEVNQMRDEVSRLRVSVDAKRTAIGAQQDMISARLDEERSLSKQMAYGAGASALAAAPGAEQAGQKRRNAPVPPPFNSSDGLDAFQDDAPPAPALAPSTGNAFDAFDNDPYEAPPASKGNEW